MIVLHLLFLPLLFIPSAHAITANPETRTEIQPDGTAVTILSHGDVFNHFETDINDFLVVQDGNGTYFYADEDGAAIANAQVGTETIPKEVGKRSNKRTKKKIHSRQATCFKKKYNKNDIKKCRKHTRALNSQEHRRTSPVNTTGTLRNLVILLHFADHAKDKKRKKDIPSVEEIDELMNSDNVDPWSLKMIYKELSYGSLTIESTVTPWFKTKESEAYYSDQVSGISTKLHEAMRDSLDFLDENELIVFQDFDMVTFLHSGYSAEFMGRDCYKSHYADRIWSHFWELRDAPGKSKGPWRSQSGVIVSNYHISSALWGMCGNEIARIGCLAHETAHSLGLPDLYDTDDSGGNGLGNYDMLANSWGWNSQQRYTGHMSAWAKLQMNWMTPKRPKLGINTVEYAESLERKEDHLYKIGDGEFGFPFGEYLLIENRQPFGLDSLLPHGGLAIYHIDESASFDSEGYPGQLDWPQNHYKVALLQADGLYRLEKGLDMGSSGDLFHGDFVNELLSGPYSFPNTDSYMGGIFLRTGVGIHDITVSGKTMSFVFSYDNNTKFTSLPSSSSMVPSTTRPSSIGPSLSPTTYNLLPSANSSLPVSLSPTSYASSSIPTAKPSSIPTPRSMTPSLSPTKTKCSNKKEPCLQDEDCCNPKATCKKRKKQKTLSVCSK